MTKQMRCCRIGTRFLSPLQEQGWMCKEEDEKVAFAAVVLHPPGLLSSGRASMNGMPRPRAFAL
ncbi:MAG: hypothetical protein K0A99_07970 [Desulfoarculaceae bacterium]|nr:hypothetical protein [Desulfoarculaceae bacterium]